MTRLLKALNNKYVLLHIFFFGCLLLSSVIEVVFINIPIVVMVSIVLFLLRASIGSAIIILINSYIFDSIKLLPLGVTGSFIFAMLLGICLYQQKFEVRSLPFILTVTSIIVVVYSLLFAYRIPYSAYTISIIFVIVFYKIGLRLFRRENKYSP